jgi:cyclic pyranopterin phosphate synthase
MPAEGIELSPKENIMRAEEIIAIADKFVKLGVNKIRLTGGEPLVRKDFTFIAESLNAMNVKLALTTNGILLNEYFDLFDKIQLHKINVSLDTLKEEKFSKITRREYFQRVTSNIEGLITRGIHPKINVVLIRGVNDEEIIDFIDLSHQWNTTVQFIEFMPFQGNKWDGSKTITAKEILEKVKMNYGEENVFKSEDAFHDTSRKYAIRGRQGNFGIISTVSNPFCDTCNRIRLTANGRIKNCLFSQSETDLLTAYRAGENLESLIIDSVMNKKKQRGGIEDFNEDNGRALADKNRSMILIGG